MSATPGQIAAQSTAISKVRQTIGLALANLAMLKSNLTVVTALNGGNLGFDTFDPGAYAGNNGDVTAADLDAGIVAIGAILTTLETAGVPNANQLALALLAE